MTAPVVKLIQGATTFSLGGPKVWVGSDFAPPDVQILPLIAEGTSANRLNGGIKVGERGQNLKWTFRVEIRACSSEADVRAQVAHLRAFLARAGDASLPVYLYYKSNSDTTLDPLWGQSYYLYEIVQGGLTLSPADLQLRNTSIPHCTLTLTIKPYARGQAQLLASATGGLLPDQWGTTDGAERGLMVLETTTNKMTNPVFGNATWNTGWTPQANVIASQNTNPNFLLPQTQSSAFLQCNGAANGFTQSINVGNTHTYALSALIMRPDGGTPTSADILLVYATNLTTTFLNLGDGLWLATATVAGIASAQAVGVLVLTGRSIYLLAFQIEDAAYSTPMCWGDLLGCTWAGTVHASASSRTVAQAKLAVDDTILRTGQGSVAITVIPNVSSATVARDCYLFSLGLTNLRALWQNAVPGFIFLDPSNAHQATQAASSFAAGVPIVVHVTWGPSGSFIYVNGVQVATNATYTPNALGASLYIGSSTVPNNHWPGTIADFRTFSYALSATEVSNDYTNTSKVSGATVDACQRVGAIPWRYTVAGDDIVSGVYGLVNSVQKYNYCVFGGIPGSAPAQTELKLTDSVPAGSAVAIYLSRLPLPFFFSPSSLLYADFSGVADVGNSSGDAYQSTSVTTTSTTGQVSLGPVSYGLLQGKEVYMFMRLKDAGATLTVAILFQYGGAGYITDYAAAGAGPGFQTIKTVPFLIPLLRNVFTGQPTISALFDLTLKRTTAGAANVGLDFFVLMPRPLTILDYSQGNASATVIRVINKTTFVDDGTTFNEIGSVKGDIFELDPGVYNLVTHVLRGITQTSFVTDALTHTAAWVTPRYALL